MGKSQSFYPPRRFGKSLNMSMLQSFLEIGCDPAWFEGLAISGEKDLCERYMGQFPVISISLKSVNGPDYHTARALMCSVIGAKRLDSGSCLIPINFHTRSRVFIGR